MVDGYDMSFVTKQCLERGESHGGESVSMYASSAYQYIFIKELMNLSIDCCYLECL